MIKKVIVSFALQVLLTSAGLCAQQAVTINSFATAAKLALQNNMDIANSALDIEGNQERFRETLSDGLPQIKASGRANDYMVIPTTVYPASALGGPPGEMVAFQVGTNYNVDGALTVRQMLFDASFFTGLSIAGNSTQLSKYALCKTKENVIMQLAGAYYGSLLSRKQTEFLQKQLDSYKSLLHVVEIQVQTGVAQKSDLDRIQVNKTNIETELDNIRNVNEEQINNLKLLIGLGGEKQVVILDSITDTPIFNEENDSFDIHRRTDWRILQKQEEIKLLEVRQEQDGYLPVLSVTAQANKDYYDNEFKPLNNDWYNSSFVALTLDIPIFDGLRKNAQIARSRLEGDQLHNQKMLLQSKASIEIQDAYNKLNYSNDRVQSQKKNQELAEEVYRETSVQYNNGTASLSDLLNAEGSLLESQRQYLQALADKILAEVTIQNAKGVLLHKLNID